MPVQWRKHSRNFSVASTRRQWPVVCHLLVLCNCKNLTVFPVLNRQEDARLGASSMEEIQQKFFSCKYQETMASRLPSAGALQLQKSYRISCIELAGRCQIRCQFNGGNTAEIIQLQVPGDNGQSSAICWCSATAKILSYFLY